MSLSTLIKSIQDIMRQDAGVDGDAQRISQLTWILFLKIFDDHETELELLRGDYRSPLPEHYRWRNWAANPEGLTGDALLDFVNQQVFPKLKNLNASADTNPRAWVVQQVFEDAYNYMKSGHLLRQVINKVQGIDFNNRQDRHLFNDIYEKVLRDLQSAGNAGEFYTPRAVTQFMTDMVDPQLGEMVLDPACGTGGFLVCTLEHLRRQVKNVADEEQLQKSVAGVEKKPLPHLLAVTNMLLHGVEVPSSIHHGNTLARPLRDYGPKNRVDVILTNPPFGGVEEPGIEANFPADVRTKETADLFMTLVLHLLKPTGRAAVVLPDGFLFGEGVKTRLKERLLTECNLHTIVRLPNGVFAPYTGIKTNLLFFQKGEATKEVWFYEHPYPPGYKSYSKTKPMRIEEFDAEKAWWRNRVENEHAWRVSVADLQARNYNLDLKNPHDAGTESHDPAVLLHELAGLDAEIATLKARLKDALAGALKSAVNAPAMRIEEQAAPYRVAPLLTDHLDIFASAPEGFKRLRELVLNLAVRGKLVPQDLNDEPASQAISRIVAARDTYRVKPSKARPHSTDECPPYTVPSGWAWARLSDLTRVLNGRAYAKEELLDSGTPVLRVGNLFTSNHWYYSNLILEDDKYCDAGDLLFAWSASFGPFIWKGPRVIYHYHIWKLSLFSEACLTKNYLYTFLTEKTAEIKAAGHGVSMVHMTKEKMEQIFVPVPPLAEQSRIVAKVEEMMALIAALEAKVGAGETARGQLAAALTESALA